MKNLEEKENELKKFRGIRGLPEDIWDEVVEERKISGSGSNVDGVRFEIPPERIIPRKGTLTLEEAERFADLQVSTSIVSNLYWIPRSSLILIFKMKHKN